uniref:DEP domain containing MTOR interacting protein n=1 Tax=Leptobrachium leishanense TaxID=445787 RepID=A0A8C5MSV6_9ANUR
MFRLHEERIIKDRRYHLKTYPNCFVAREAVKWLIERKEAADKEIAMKLMQKLMDTSIIHHAVNETEIFKGGKGYYRFRKDDGTLPLDQEVKVFIRGQRIYEKVMNTENFLLQAREEDGVKYDRTLLASQFVDWLTLEREAKSRPEAVQLCRRLLEHAVIQHVAGKYHFVDSGLLYQFRLNFRRRRRLMELLNEKPQAVLESHDSPFCLRKQSHDKASNFHSVSPTNEVKTVSGMRRSSLSSSGSFGGFYHNVPFITSSFHMPLSNPKSVLKRPVTVEELFVPGAPYIRKTLTIVSDAVGWGFVVRGEKPCHIQAVDPSGPAAAGGVKLRQFVVSVNGVNCLDMDFRKVSNKVLNGPRTIVMEVMEEIKS